MKANEAPEKIYIDANEDWHRTYTAFTEKAKGNDIEYTRTDAFIEKVLDYIENNIYNHYDGDHEYGICSGYVKKEEFIEDFKKYLKGE